MDKYGQNGNYNKILKYKLSVKKYIVFTFYILGAFFLIIRGYDDSGLRYYRRNAAILSDGGIGDVVFIITKRKAIIRTYI